MIFDLNKVEQHKAANIYNNICLIIIISVTVLNMVISGFDLKTDAFFTAGGGDTKSAAVTH